MSINPRGKRSRFDVVDHIGFGNWARLLRLLLGIGLETSFGELRLLLVLLLLVTAEQVEVVVVTGWFGLCCWRRGLLLDCCRLCCC
jgi:hypothetical protein